MTPRMLGARRRALPHLRARASASSPTRAPPRCASSPRTPFATSTSPLPTSCRSICDELGINVWELIRLANHHPRVNILQPGPGVGGHCIAVDPWFIVAAAPEEARLIRTAREVNDGKPRVVLDKIKAAIAETRVCGAGRPKVALLGLAFKADVDDLRESPALLIAETVAGWENCDVMVSEPNIDELPDFAARQGTSYDFATDVHDAVAEAHDRRDAGQPPPLLRYQARRAGTARCSSIREASGREAAAGSVG